MQENNNIVLKQALASYNKEYCVTVGNCFSSVILQKKEAIPVKYCGQSFFRLNATRLSEKMTAKVNSLAVISV